VLMVWAQKQGQGGRQVWELLQGVDCWKGLLKTPLLHLHAQVEEDVALLLEQEQVRDEVGRGFWERGRGNEGTWAKCHVSHLERDHHPVKKESGVRTHVWGVCFTVYMWLRISTVVHTFAGEGKCA